MKRFLQIISGCIAFGRNCNAGTLIDLDDLSDRDKAGAFILIGSGLARIVERYPAKAEPAQAEPAEADQKTTKKAKK